jgi:hypothetical protein
MCLVHDKSEVGLSAKLICFPANLFICTLRSLLTACIPSKREKGEMLFEFYQGRKPGGTCLLPCSVSTTWISGEMSVCECLLLAGKHA